MSNSSNAVYVICVLKFPGMNEKPLQIQSVQETDQIIQTE